MQIEPLGNRGLHFAGMENKITEKGCYDNCKCDHYCQLRADAGFYREICEKLNQDWPPPTYSTVSEQTALQFSGIEVVLRRDGTYHLSDTTGG